MLVNVVISINYVMICLSAQQLGPVIYNINIFLSVIMI